MIFSSRIFSSRISKTLVYVLCAALLGSLQITSSVASGRQKHETPEQRKRGFYKNMEANTPVREKNSPVRKLDFAKESDEGEAAKLRKQQEVKRLEEEEERKLKQQREKEEEEGKEEEAKKKEKKSPKKSSESKGDGSGPTFLTIAVGGCLFVIVGLVLFFNAKKKLKKSK